MSKLICCIMGQNVERFIRLCYESVKEAEVVIFCDGGSSDGTIDYLLENGFNMEGKGNRRYIYNCYDQKDLGMNGKQRNFYLNYLKQNYPDDWALCLDADEVVEDLNKIKEFIQTADSGVYSVNMRHFIGDLGHEDSMVEEHFVPHRLFKISEADSYPEVEHPVLSPKASTRLGLTKASVIWHLAYIPNLFEIKKRYDNHMKKSNMHTPEYLKNWYYQHLFGQYPRKQINLTDIPKVILKEFGIDKDEFYFANRGITIKNVIMVKQWADYFKPKSILDLGAGRGPYLYFWKWFVEEAQGIELSEWAVKNAFCNGIIQGNISEEKLYRREMAYYKWDLITAIDVLEHLNDENLDKALKNMEKYGYQFLFSIPFEGDPNLLNDKTHLQFHTKEWWINKIESYGIKVKDPPKEWLFAQQLLIGEAK